MSDQGKSPAGTFDAPEPAELTALLKGYEVHDLIACGGMGAVYRAEQLSLGREVAIKVLPRELAGDETFRTSFESEARAMAKLAHPNLIGVYDFGQVEGMLYLVMEFVAGDSLYAASHGQTVDPKQAVEIVRGIATGLGQAHDEGIVHRDIKAANVLIGEDLVPKLGDFGLAVPSDDVGSGMVMGTPGYVAPEVLQDPETAGPASDVFALGVLLHQLLTGITPDWDTPSDVDLVPELGSLRSIVRKAVSLEASMRYADGTAMAEALGGWLKESGKGFMKVGGAKAPGPAFAKPVAPRAPVSASGSGGGFGTIALIGVLVVAVIGVGVWLVGSGDSGPPPVASPPPAVPAPPEETPPPAPAPPVVRDTGAHAPEPDPVDPPPRPTLAGIREKYVTALEEARKELIGRRLANREALVAAIQNQGLWKPYFALVDDEVHLLPDRFPERPGVGYNRSLIPNFVDRRQEDLNGKHALAVQELHRECLRDLAELDGAPREDIEDHWEDWVEWLGLGPVHVLAGDLAGRWELEGDGGEDVVVTILRSGKARISLGEEEISGGDLFQSSRDGRIVISGPPGDSPRQWSLRWRTGTLVGSDESGKECRFLHRRGPVVEDAAEALDPELAALRTKYLEAVRQRIEPLVAGYRKEIAAALALAERRDNARYIDQCDAELRRIDGIPWKTGCVDLEGIDWESDVPISSQGKKSIFDRGFRERMERLQDAYIGELKKLRGQHSARKKNLRPVEFELARFELPPGTIRARYVKFQSDEAPEELNIGHCTIGEFNLLDMHGDPLPRDSMQIHDVSSTQGPRGGNPPRDPGNVLDGRPGTFWHSRWNPSKAPFPHWIAIDMGKEHAIRGFRVLPRQEQMRWGDPVRWTLFTSPDGEEWTQAARGFFAMSQEEKEFRFGP